MSNTTTAAGKTRKNKNTFEENLTTVLKRFRQNIENTEGAESRTVFDELMKAARQSDLTPGTKLSILNAIMDASS